MYKIILIMLLTMCSVIQWSLLLLKSYFWESGSFLSHTGVPIVWNPNVGLHKTMRRTGNLSYGGIDSCYGKIWGHVVKVEDIHDCRFGLSSYRPHSGVPHFGQPEAVTCGTEYPDSILYEDISGGGWRPFLMGSDFSHVGPITGFHAKGAHSVVSCQKSSLTH